MSKTRPGDLRQTPGDAALPEPTAKKTKPGEGPDFEEKPEVSPHRPERMAPRKKRASRPSMSCCDSSISR